MTWQYYRFLSDTIGFPLGKFVISNPFGPFEEPLFCNYLVPSWFKGVAPSVRTPLYVRDVHVDLLGASCAAFVKKLPAQNGVVRFNLGLYVESQGAFAARFAGEMAPHLGGACPIALLQQSEFGEPMVRINTDGLDGLDFGWSEAAAWDAEAGFYQARARI